MPAERLSMRNVREILRLKGLGLSLGQITASTGVPRTTAHGYLLRAKVAGIGWPLPEGLDDAALERLLFVTVAETGRDRPLPDWASIREGRAPPLYPRGWRTGETLARAERRVEGISGQRRSRARLRREYPTRGWETAGPAGCRWRKESSRGRAHR